MKDIKLSTVLPKHHVRAGQPTHFVEKIWTAVAKNKEANKEATIKSALKRANHFQRSFIKSYASKDWTPKRTTIRAGHRWKKGDLFIPKIWTGKPYRSRPIAICDPLEILETEQFVIDMDGCYWLGDDMLSLGKLKTIALEDGFDDVDDFELWFNMKKGKNFEGQRIRFA